MTARVGSAYQRGWFMGTEKVQTGVVGGRRFLLFFLLDAFFLKSLTASETPDKKKKTQKCQI